MLYKLKKNLFEIKEVLALFQFFLKDLPKFIYQIVGISKLFSYF